MSVVITPKMARAMSTQLERVNGDQSQQPNEATILQNRLQSAQDEIARLNDIIDALQQQLRKATGNHDEDTISGRPVLSVTQASQQTGIPPHTVYRYINSGHWQATKRGAQWLVYADQPLTKKKDAKRGRKKKA